MSKLYLYLGGLIAIALAFGTYTYHERAIGAELTRQYALWFGSLRHAHLA